MSVQFMITNGGPHPPEKWADITARAIADLIVIEPTAPEGAIAEKRAFEAALFTLLVDLHAQEQRHERSAIRYHGQEHLTSPIGTIVTHRRVAAAVDAVSDLAKTTRFAEHFMTQSVRDFAYRVISQHFADSRHIERSWHADRNASAKS